MEVSNSILIHHLLQLTGSIGSIACVITALNVPWAHPKVPMSRGLYEIDVPIDIGLLRCFSSICKQYESIEQFLIDNSGRDIHGNSTSTLSAETPLYLTAAQAELYLTSDHATDYPGDGNDGADSPSDASSPWHLPLPHSLNHIKSPLVLERNAIRTFLRPYRTASLVTITFLALSTLLAVYLTVLILYRICCFRYSKEVSMGQAEASAVIPFHNLLLVLTLFTMFLATMAYLMLTCSHLNGGRYVDGVWITAYCCICGLLCCLISAILKEPRHRGGYMPIYDEEEDLDHDHRHHRSPSRHHHHHQNDRSVASVHKCHQDQHRRHYQSDTTQTLIEEEGDVELSKASAPPLH